MEIICLRIQGATPCPTFEGLRSVNIVARDSSGGIQVFRPPETTWRIIPVSKWLVTPTYKPFSPFGSCPTTLLRGLTITCLLTTYKSWDFFFRKMHFRTLGTWTPGPGSSSHFIVEGLDAEKSFYFNLVPFHPTGTFAPARQLVWP